MVAILAGSMALLMGLVLLLLPLLASELSRPRDSVWGAVVLLLGLDLVTTAERLRGAPMLAVLCGGLLMVRLGGEVGQSRWRQLSPEEQRRLSSAERWRSSIEQVLAAFLGLVEGSGRVLGGLGAWIAERRRAPTVTKRWVRPESPTATEPAEVASFAEVEELLRAAGTDGGSEEEEPTEDPGNSENAGGAGETG